MTFVYCLAIICTPLNACSTTTFSLLNSVPTFATLQSIRSFGGLHKSRMAYERFPHKTAGHHCRVCGKKATRKSFGCYACTDCSLSFMNDVQYNLADSYKCANNTDIYCSTPSWMFTLCSPVFFGYNFECGYFCKDNLIPLDRSGTVAVSYTSCVISISVS